MTLEQLKHLAQAGVKVEVSAADLLQVVTELTKPKQESHAPQFIPMSEAERAYGRNRKALMRYVRDGIIKGEMLGGRYMLEAPLTRYNRLNGGATI